MKNNNIEVHTPGENKTRLSEYAKRINDYKLKKEKEQNNE